MDPAEPFPVADDSDLSSIDVPIDEISRGVLGCGGIEGSNWTIQELERRFPPLPRNGCLDVKRVLQAIFLLFLYGYALLVGLLLVFGPRLEGHWIVATLNSVRFYWLSPAWFLLILVALTRRRALLLLYLVIVASWGLAFGELWLPRFDLPDLSGDPLKVMSYNVLVINRSEEQVVAVIEESGADLVGFQEMNPTIATALVRRLSDRYPYHHLDVENAVLSRYPVERREVALPAAWGELSPPQVYALSIDGRETTWINTHHFAPMAITGDHAEGWILENRRLQAEAVASFARSEIEVAGRPVLFTTDLNATDQNGVHGVIASVLSDAWREAGTGLGLTWRYQNQLMRLPLSAWFARIDFVFHSDHWLTESVRVGPWDGRSDHRPVMATLRWRVGE